jgi:DNA invertase Pin-like site-specific DNA recombinase
MAKELTPEQELLLGSIEDKHNLSSLTAYEVDELVLTAHAGGVSWERIAARLGVSRQAVTEKYGDMERRRKSDEFNKQYGR